MKKRLKTCIPALLAAAMLSAGCTTAFAEESGSHLNVAMCCGIGETLLTADENMDVVP